MSWTNVPKPVGPTYTNVNTVGKEQYDQPDITYDSSTVFYDGANPNQWTNVLKPTTIYTWNSLPVPWSSFVHPWQSPTWSLVDKPV